MFAQPEVCFPCLELIPSNGTFCSTDAGPAAGPGALPPVDPLAPLHVQAGGPDHLQEYSHDQEAEGDGQERNIFKISPGKYPGY